VPVELLQGSLVVPESLLAEQIRALRLVRRADLARDVEARAAGTCDGLTAGWFAGRAR
jgi:hypothetical protein